MVGAECNGSLFRLRRGQMVEVRSRREIMATLDSNGRLEELPFMPEMAKYCGRRFRIHRSAEKLFLDHYCYIARMKGTAFLEGVRCDGGSHGQCRMGCLILWKAAWLKPVQSSEPAERVDIDECSSGEVELPTMKDGKFCCQVTELVGATSRLPWWDVRQYLRDLVTREVAFGEFVRMLALLACNKLRRMFGLEPYGSVSGKGKKTLTCALNLQPGELVEVKSRAEIEATLDALGRNRGLGFGSEMLQFCGRRYPVASRADQIIVEWSGQMRKPSNTVVLEDVVCKGTAQRCCPRACYHLWREIWLERVSEPGVKG